MPSDDWEMFSVETLNSIASVQFSEDQVIELIGISIAKGTIVGQTNTVGVTLKNKLKVIANSIERVLGHLDDGTPEAEYIKKQFVSQDLLDELVELQESTAYHHDGVASQVSNAGRGRRRDVDLEVFVNRCRGVWTACGGQGVGSYASSYSPTGYDGPLLRLVKHLLLSPSAPSDATIHASILRASRERVENKKES